ncbi:MAG: adenylate/guanylate cyclase domain-containing protein, partial [Pseudomonadota bacterium]|nr:adenylate/guanylate cyclase domain-containing protein [Pseudomonadota bacterium]
MTIGHPRTAASNTGTNGRATMSLGWLLALSFGGLVALSVGAVLFLSVTTNFVNTFSLLNDRAIKLFEDMERQIRAEASQAERAVSVVARLHAQGRIELDGSGRNRPVLDALLMSMPSVEGVFVFRDRQLADAAFRRPEGAIGAPPAAFRQADLAERFSLAGDQAPGTTRWNTPVIFDGSMFLSVVRRFATADGGTGTAVAVVGRDSISRIMVQLGRDTDATVFLLLPDNAVVAHSVLPHVFKDKAAIPLGEFPDVTLRRINDTLVERESFERAARQGINVAVTGGRDDAYLFMTKEMPGLTSTPLRLGIYFPRADIGEEVLRVVTSMFVGAAALVVAVLAAVVLGRYLSRPMQQIARTASQFSSFEIDEITPVPRSRVREIDEQAQALNRMHATLRQFTRYVPRELVARLMRSGSDSARPVEREMTIMFTDIAGFTSLSEEMDAGEVTELLNRHFAMVTRHVEATGGTIDKFLGDGVMAFWGAPEDDAEHALHAVIAARAIVGSIRLENQDRRARNEAELRMRIGIHTGRVVVGNIGG